jgi:hypothetical protein
MRVLAFLCLVTGATVLGAVGAGATQPYSTSSSPEARYESYRKSLEGGTGGAPAPTLYNRKDARPSSGGAGGSAKIFNLKQILNSGGGASYGMKSMSATPPVPYGSKPKGPQSPPSAAQLQDMARQDRERTVQQAVAESDARLARIKRMQEEIYAQQTGTTTAGAAVPAGAGGNTDPKQMRKIPKIQYTYRKTDPAQVKAPPRVFLSDR